MTRVIVVFPKIEDAKAIRNLLTKNGYAVEAVCNTGAAALQNAEQLSDGVVLCGYKLPDMMYTELREYLPTSFEMLLLASRDKLVDSIGTGVVCVEMPLKLHELLSTIGMLIEGIERRRKKRRLQPKTRNEEEQKLINQAKELLMARNNLTEDEAHKYLQKTSMDSGTNIVETAQMVLTIMS